MGRLRGKQLRRTGILPIDRFQLRTLDVGIVEADDQVFVVRRPHEILDHRAGIRVQNLKLAGSHFHNAQFWLLAVTALSFKTDKAAVVGPAQGPVQGAVSRRRLAHQQLPSLACCDIEQRDVCSLEVGDGFAIGRPLGAPARSVNDFAARAVGLHHDDALTRLRNDDSAAVARKTWHATQAQVFDVAAIGVEHDDL